ncbi:hypothetical protein Fmac_011696 [Flemingia macrophylla]|uniref:Uncharacterized protein n=1 Tax=Flemingia macrophylla TaxID=520843 RepID=A0ABD1MQ94_9FABA
MNSGMGETSYAKNSMLQKKVMLKVKPILEESIKRFLSSTNFGSNLRIADLGCSSGSNTFVVLYDIITIINNTKVSLNRDAPAYVLQVYLNDLFENDFNNITKLLPNFYQKLTETGDKVSKCFVHTTPGNFFGRLFPNNYMHFFHSSYSVHWLSQPPEELTKGVEALNTGNTYITTTSSPTVYKAYFEQFQRDFKVFLRSRYDELKPCGIMGLVEEAKLDSFNLPIYGPTIEEVRQVIETEGSFILETLKTFKIGWDANIEEEVGDYVLNNKMRGEFKAKSILDLFLNLF